MLIYEQLFLNGSSSQTYLITSTRLDLPMMNNEEYSLNCLFNRKHSPQIVLPSIDMFFSSTPIKHKKANFKDDEAIQHLENLCDRLGFRLRSKDGRTRLKNFFLFPSGNNVIACKTSIKKMKLAELSRCFLSAYQSFPDKFTPQNYQMFKETFKTH
jgi:hypothetical protein